MPGSMTPLIGRDEELDLLLRRWRQAKSGEGQLVLLSGEPGIGKSRLIAALEERLRGEPHDKPCGISARRTIRTAPSTRSSRGGSET